MNEAVEIYENKVKKLETELNQRQRIITLKDAKIKSLHLKFE